MANTADPSPKKVHIPDPHTPDEVSESSTSEEATSTKSSELKTDDGATLRSEPSTSTPAKQSSDSGSSKESGSGGQTPQEGGIESPKDSIPSGKEAEDERTALIQRRRGKEHQDEDEELQAIEPVAEHVISVEPARRSPTGRRFVTSLTRSFEISNEYFVNFLCGWQAYSLFLTDSQYLVVVQIALIALSLANVFMGSLHFNDCKLSPFLPMLVIIVGLIGMFVMVFRMILVLNQLYSMENSRFLRKIILVLNCFYLMGLCWEFTDYMMLPTPSTVKEDSAYCDQFFLSYIMVYHCIAFTIVFISLILHGPAYLFYSWKIGGPGLPDSSA